MSTRFTPLNAEHSTIVKDKVALSRVPAEYRQYVEQYSAQYGVPPEIAATVFDMESRYNPKARSQVGAMGIAQFMPNTWKDVTKGDPTASPWNPEDSIKYGTKYLGQMLNQTGGDIDKALAAYNWGIGNVKKLADKGQFALHNLPNETQNYLMKAKNMLGGSIPAMSSVRPQMEKAPQMRDLMVAQTAPRSGFSSALRFEELMNMMGN